MEHSLAGGLVVYFGGFVEDKWLQMGKLMLQKKS